MQKKNNIIKENENLLITYKLENEQLKKKYQILESLVIDKEIENQNLKSKKNINKINQNLTNINFYDVIINIKSIMDICKGWEVKFSKRAEEKYNELKKERNIRIGVLGNSNKGKSFLLSRISKMGLPSGNSIRTEGLSIKYPEFDLHKDRRITLLDSAGLNAPVLIDDRDREDRTEEKMEKKK